MYLKPAMDQVEPIDIKAMFDFMKYEEDKLIPSLRIAISRLCSDNSAKSEYKNGEVFKLKHEE